MNPPTSLTPLTVTMPLVVLMTVSLLSSAPPAKPTKPPTGLSTVGSVDVAVIVPPLTEDPVIEPPMPVTTSGVIAPANPPTKA